MIFLFQILTLICVVISYVMSLVLNPLIEVPGIISVAYVIVMTIIFLVTLVYMSLRFIAVGNGVTEVCMVPFILHVVLIVVDYIFLGGTHVNLMYDIPIIMGLNLMSGIFAYIDSRHWIEIEVEEVNI